MIFSSVHPNPRIHLLKQLCGGMEMVKFTKYARNTAILTGASLLMRCIGLVYQVWLSGRIGAAGIGLWQLVMSVSALSATLAISGIRFTATRLVSEELGKGTGRTDAAVHRCLLYAAAFGTVAFLILYFGAEAIGFLWIGDARTVKSLRILAFTMPMISLSSVLNGYYIASGQPMKTAAVQITEQISGVLCVMLLLRHSPSGDLERCCAAVALGNLLADGISLLLISASYLFDRGQRQRDGCAGNLTGRMLRIALPLAVSAYMRMSLSTLENLLVPKMLRSAGFSADRALTGYGLITGMVFPIISFPSCLLSAAAELTVPALTGAQMRGARQEIRRKCALLLRAALAYSFATAVFLFLFARPLGVLIYHTEAAGTYIRILAFLVPVMHTDMITDGCLKGLGQMLWSMGCNVAESLIGVLLVVTVLPRRALGGYIFILYFCEIFNFSMSIARLRKVAGLQPFKAVTAKKFSAE